MSNKEYPMSKGLKRFGFVQKKEPKLVFIPNQYQEQRLTWKLEIPCWILDIKIQGLLTITNHFLNGFAGFPCDFKQVHAYRNWRLGLPFVHAFLSVKGFCQNGLTT